MQEISPLEFKDVASAKESTSAFAHINRMEVPSSQETVGEQQQETDAAAVPLPIRTNHEGRNPSQEPMAPSAREVVQQPRPSGAPTQLPLVVASAVQGVAATAPTTTFNMTELAKVVVIATVAAVTNGMQQQQRASVALGQHQNGTGNKVAAATTTLREPHEQLAMPCSSYKQLLI